MKFAVIIFVAVLTLNGVFALPAKIAPQDEVEVIDVPRRRVAQDAEPDYKDFGGVIDTGAGYPFLRAHPVPFSFNLGFFDSIEDIFRRLRTRIFPVIVDGGDVATTSEEDNFSFKLDPKKANSTSTVKVVDGHKIEINDTVYGGDNQVFRVRIVNIRPVDSDEATDTDTFKKAGAGSNDESDIKPFNASSDEDTIKKTYNPATSAPRKDLESELDDLNERREPLESKSDENEIRGNNDDSEVKRERF